MIYFASFFSVKAKKWLAGRKTWRDELKKEDWGENLIWIHVASYGEFEQGRPVIEKLKKYFPNYEVLLTFFSTSGYEKFHDYKEVDFVHYLPLDIPKNAEFFIQTVRPSIAVFVRYEFWFNFLREIQKARVPIVFFSASFRKEQIYFKKYGRWFLEILRQCNQFLVRDQFSADILESNRINQVQVMGDTRFDSVYNNMKEGDALPRIEQFKGSSQVLVCGSTWPEDETLLLNFLNAKASLNFKVIIAPHEINQEKIADFQGKLKHQSSLYSSTLDSDAKVLILDTVGLLKNVYRYAAVSYVGGGFGKGIHNLLEPAVYGIPVLFGPRHEKFAEARELIEITQGVELNKSNFSLMLDKAFEMEQNAASKDYFKRHLGASKKVLLAIEKGLGKA